MTVAELIAELQKLPGDAEVLVDTNELEGLPVETVYEHRGDVVIDCTEDSGR